MRKTPEEKTKFKKRTCIFTWTFTLRQVSVSECANQPPDLSLRGTLTPKGVTANGSINYNIMYYPI